MNISIRLAVPGDAAEMAEILMRSWEVAYKGIIPDEYIREKNASRPEQYKRAITAKNTDSYVIRRDGKTVGIMRVASPQNDDVGDDFYELHYIYLHPDYYRQGIGSKAMVYAFNIACNLGKKYMVVWVFADNINSIKFYEKCGFRADGKIATRDFGKPLTSIRMKKVL